MNDDDLVVRLRAGIDALAREAGGAPPLPRAAASAPDPGPRRTWRTAGAILTVAAVAAGVVFMIVRTDPEQQVASGGPTTTADGAQPLLDTRWWLMSATDRGARIDVPTTGTPSLELRFLDGGTCEGIDAGCYDGPRIEGSDACNGVSRKMTIDGDTVTLGEDYGVHTAMGCGGDGLAGVMPGFFQADAITYSIDGDELVLTSTSGEVVLTYQAIDTPFGPTSSLVVDDGELEGQAYRLVWGDGGLDFQVLATSYGGAGGSGVGEDPGRVNAMLSEVAGQPYLFGIVPATATRVVYEPAGADPQEVDIHDVGDPELAVIGQLVEAGPQTWDLVAYDAAGREIHRLQWG